MRKQGLDVYLPLSDDDAIAAVIRRPNGAFTTVQIKARSREYKVGDGALFAAIPREFRENYRFTYFSGRMDMMWIMTSAGFIAESHQNKEGKNKGKRMIWFNGRRPDLHTGAVAEHCKSGFERYLETNFSRLVSQEPAQV